MPSGIDISAKNIVLQDGGRVAALLYCHDFPDHHFPRNYRLLFGV